MKKYAKVLILALCCALLVSTVVLAADSVKKTIEATYRDIKLVVDGVPVTPKDANGSVVEPFIYNGTTYLPVRAVGEALGKTVSWDGATSTVYIGNVPGEDIYLLDVCRPYETCNYSAPEQLTVMGKPYFKSFSIGTSPYNGSRDGYAFFNFDGEYNTLSFDVGHVDKTTMAPSTCKIYLDGELVKTISLSSDMMLTHYDIPLNGALQCRIVVLEESGNWGVAYGFVNITLS